MAISKVTIAKGVFGLGILFGGAIALTIVGFVIWLLVMWANAHFVSFAIIAGIAVAVGLVVGGYHALNWASGVIEQAKVEEKQAQYQMQQEKRMIAYKEKWGEEHKPPRDHRNNSYYWDQPPVNKQQGMNAVG